MHLLLILVTVAAAGCGFWWFVDVPFPWKETMVNLAYLRTTHSLEARYDMQQVVETQQKRLLKEKGARIVETSVKLYPYLLIEAKYTAKKKTKEGLLLWDLSDGEVVLDIQNWTKTHGFGDCMHAHVEPMEFRIMMVLARNGGACDRKQLQDKLEVDQKSLEGGLRSCSRKKLVQEAGDKFRLHIQNPRLIRVPKMEMGNKFPMNTNKQSNCVPKHFSSRQVEKMATMAFGTSFTVRKSTEVYLPVYHIVVKHANGVLQTHQINGLTGEPF